VSALINTVYKLTTTFKCEVLS